MNDDKNTLVAETSSNLVNLTNCMGDDSSLNAIMQHMLNCHRTLNQKFTGTFIFNFIRNMAINYKNGLFDRRNESACKMCNFMWEGLKKEMPWIKDEDNISLSLI